MYINSANKLVDITLDYYVEGEGTFTPAALADPTIRARLGITEVADPVVPDHRIFKDIYRLDDGTWHSTPKTAEEVAAETKLARSHACSEIDRVADQRRLAFVGSNSRQIEYQAAEQAARDYKAAGYTGDVPPEVTAGMVGGKTAVESTEEILAMASAWRVALQQIRLIRLGAKNTIASLADGDFDAITATVVDAVSRLADIAPNE